MENSELGVARELHPGVFVRSFYFQDPDGILLEFACWRRALAQPGDVRHEPKTAADRTVQAGAGQHFFFDMGGGNALAFFWFPDAPDPVPGVSAPVTVPGLGEWTSAVGSMNHVAFNVPEDRFLEYRAKLKAKGIRVSPILDHDDSESGVARELHPGVFVRSFYFQDPDGILLEFACWRRAMGQPGDVRHEPKTAADRAGVRV